MQCPDTPTGPEFEPVTSVSTTVSPTPPSTTRTTTSVVYQEPVVPKPSVYCSLHQMNVELPAGPISELVLKGGYLKGFGPTTFV